MSVTKEEIELYGVEILKWEEDAATGKLFMAEFFKTPVGLQIIGRGLRNLANMETVLDHAQKANGHEDVSVKEFEASAKELFLAGDLQPKKQPVEQAPAPKPLSSSQLAWQEHRVFTDSNSVAACKARARTDEGYRKFLHTNLEREMNDTPVADAAVAIGTQAVRQDKSIRINEDLRAFADAYRRTSTAEVKRMSSVATNTLGHKQYTDLLDACIAAGLV
jgi:hypothetical protein